MVLIKAYFCALYLDKVYLTDHSLDTSIIIIYEKVLVS